MQIKSVVIGLGKIGMGYDYFSSKSKMQKITSHANALNIHSNFSLSGGVDSNILKRSTFYKKYKVNAYSSYTRAIEKTKPGLVVVSTPIHTHYEILKKIIKIKNIKIILCEKPITDSIVKTRKIYKLFIKSKKLFFVNYIRQYDPIINKVSRSIKRDISNSSAEIIVNYYNGFYNNASHMLFLISKLFGFNPKIKILSYKKKNPNIYSNVNFEIKYKKATVKFFSKHQKTQKIKNEIEIILPNKKIIFSFRSGKIFIYKKKRKIKSFNTYMNISQYNVLNNISNYLKKKEKVLCNTKDAIRVEGMLNDILKKI